MCKKVLIASLAVVVALAVIKGTWVASHVRCWKQQIKESIEARIPPEQEIARLKMELKNLERKDGEFFEQVARQGVRVEKLEAKVSARRANLTAAEKRIRDMRTSLTGEAQQVTFDGRRKSRTDLQADLRLAAARFEADEAALNSMEEQLAAEKEAYDLNHKKLLALKVERQKMLTELTRLETALAKERKVQAQEANTLDDAAYQQLRKDMDSVRDRISVMKKTHELKKEVRGEEDTRAADERREQDARIDQFIEKRFGNGKAEGQ